MTRRVGKVLIIEAEAPQQCDLCGRIAELRPYGPRGEMVCFRCGMLDEAAALERFTKRLEQATLVIERGKGKDCNHDG